MKNFKSYILIMLCIWLFSLYLIRGVVLSGYPIYPSPTGKVNVEWKVPSEEAKSDLNWTKSWARKPFEKPSQVLGNWRWFQPWIKRIYQNDKKDVVFPLFLFLFGLISLLFIGKRLILKYGILRPLMFLLPAMVSLCVWFFTFPEPRFAGASFFILGIGLFSVLISLLPTLWQRWFIIAILVCNFSLCIVYLVFSFKKLQKGWHIYSIPMAQLGSRTTNSGLLVFVPIMGDQCWDASFPCTPNFNPHLTLRNPQNIQEGFQIK